LDSAVHADPRYVNRALFQQEHPIPAEMFEETPAKVNVIPTASFDSFSYAFEKDSLHFFSWENAKWAFLKHPLLKLFKKTTYHGKSFLSGIKVASLAPNRDVRYESDRMGEAVDADLISWDYRLQHDGEFTGNMVVSHVLVRYCLQHLHTTDEKSVSDLFKIAFSKRVLNIPGPNLVEVVRNSVLFSICEYCGHTLSGNSAARVGHDINFGVPL
jgi:hypothetical protein